VAREVTKVDELLYEKLADEAAEDAAYEADCQECGWPLNDPEHHCDECGECMDYCECVELDEDE
jgi:hypothetical protein